MSKRIDTSPSKVKLVHPETKDVHEFTLEHAQRMIQYQTERKHTNTQAWVLSDKETKFIIKDGKIVANSDQRDSK